MKDFNEQVNDAAREKVLDKIRKLLKLAHNSGATENEAATAARQAASLMRKYQIDQAEAMLERINDDMEFAQELAMSNPRSRKKAFTTVTPWVGFLCIAVGELFDCKVDIVSIREHDGQRGVRVRFSGHVTDVKVAAWTHEMLCNTVHRLSKSDPTARLSQRSGTAYRMGAGIRLQERLYEMKAAQDKEVEGSTGTALVLFQKKKDQVVKRFGETKSKQREINIQGIENLAYAAGQEAADKIDINRPLTGPSDTKQIGEQRRLR